MDGFQAGNVIHSIEPLVGWRCWKLGYTYTELEQEKIVYHEPRLVSIAINPEGLDQTPWPPQKKNEAIHWGTSPVIQEGELTDHVPGAHCTCGYWAYKDKDSLTGQYGMNPYAFGQVSMWGRVIEGSKGYRSQYAYPLGINVSTVVQELWNELLGEGRDIVQELAKVYAVEVVTFENVSFN